MEITRLEDHKEKGYKRDCFIEHSIQQIRAIILYSIQQVLEEGSYHYHSATLQASKKMKYTLILLASLMAATSALEESNSSACQGTISMPTFNCNCNNPQPAECPDSPQTHETSSNTSPALSCEDVARSKSNQLPSYQWIKNSTFNPVMVYCTAATQCCSQGDVGWMKVADFDMTNLHQHCPPGFKQYNNPIRACGRTLNTGGCQSLYFPIQGVSYRKVCGQIIGYQVGTPSAFSSGSTNIEGAYVDGVSITYGSNPRKHIWTLANDLYESDSNTNHNRYLCPCTSSRSPMQVPSFVGSDYFCDTGANQSWSFSLFPEDPLWNGNGCEDQNTCCSFNNPPWFYKELSESTTNDIEVHICADQNIRDEDSLIQLVELFVK